MSTIALKQNSQNITISWILLSPFVSVYLRRQMPRYFLPMVSAVT